MNFIELTEASISYGDKVKVAGERIIMPVSDIKAVSIFEGNCFVRVDGKQAGHLVFETYDEVKQKLSAAGAVL